MIGNDIIDLDCTRATTNWRRRGFLQKVFNPAERQIIDDSEDAFLAVWRLWSMKGAAYKAYLQQGGLAFNSALRISISIKNSRMGTAQINHFSSQVFTEFSDQYLLSYTQTKPQTLPSHQVFKLHNADPQSQSRETRKKLFLHLASRYQLEETELSLLKNSQNLPKIYFNSQELRFDVSLSHHGYFGAFSIAEN